MIQRLIANLPLTYTFDGESRDASVTLDSDVELIINALSREGANPVKFKPGNINVLSARLISSGAKDLEPAVGEIAGKLHLAFRGDGGESSPFTLSFAKWNELERKSVYVGMDGCGGDAVGLVLLASGTKVTCDDYNVQDSYVGQSFTPVLELEVECSGMVEA